MTSPQSKNYTTTHGQRATAKWYRTARNKYIRPIYPKELAILGASINRRKQSLDDLVSERQLIMNRRMRRKNGKN